MKILLASALYPPDIEQPAPYIKELAKRLALTHRVSLVVYGRLPEQVPGARIRVVSKRLPLPVRLSVYFFVLLREAWNAELMFVENGASVELPAALVSRLLRKPLVLHIGDTAAHARAAHGALRITAQFAARGAHIITEAPPERPEIIPFAPRPEAALAAYESAWAAHVDTLESIFSHV